jgi:hypothetical protein
VLLQIGLVVVKCDQATTLLAASKHGYIAARHPAVGTLMLQQGQRLTGTRDGHPSGFGRRMAAAARGRPYLAFAIAAG